MTRPWWSSRVERWQAGTAAVVAKRSDSASAARRTPERPDVIREADAPGSAPI